jgi:DUF4097 and DUF4098 domain-containing protein YvlB
MSRILMPALLAAFAATAAPTLALPATKPAPAVIAEQQAVMPANGPYVVSIKNVRGPVLVRAWNKNVVYVKAEKRVTNPVSGTEAQLWAGVKAAIARPAPDTLTVDTVFEVPASTLAAVVASRTPHVEVAYTVMVPPRCVVGIEQEAGRVQVVGVDGVVKAFTRDGEISVANVHGRVAADNERGDVHLQNIDGDAAAGTMHGQVSVAGVSGDLVAKTTSGSVWVTVPPRYSADVAFHTVRGDFRSDLSTFQTDMTPGEAGYVGLLRGPLAMGGAPELRYRVDTVSGTLQIANERQTAR